MYGSFTEMDGPVLQGGRRKFGQTSWGPSETFYTCNGKDIPVRDLKLNVPSVDNNDMTPPSSPTKLNFLLEMKDALFKKMKNQILVSKNDAP